MFILPKAPSRGVVLRTSMKRLQCGRTMRKCKYPRPPHEHLRGASFRKNNCAGACAPRTSAPSLSRRSLFQRKAIEKTCNRLNLPSPRRDFLKQLSVKIVRHGPAAQGTASDISANGGGAKP